MNITQSANLVKMIANKVVKQFYYNALITKTKKQNKTIKKGVKEMDTRKVINELLENNRPFNKKENLLYDPIEKYISERYDKARDVLYTIVRRSNPSFEEFDDFENALAIMISEIIRKIAKEIKIVL